VGKDDLVLDVGSGDKPHWRADVLVDKFAEEDAAAQRATGGAAALVAPLFDADLVDLPFRDRAFDYAICSHVLEHVVDPARSLAELMRVSKRGYVEVPYVGYQKIHDFETHLWHCSKERDGTLLFRAKERQQFDEDISAFHAHPEIAQGLAEAIRRRPESAIVQAYWTESSPLSVRVVGEPNLELLHAGGDIGHSHSRASTVNQKAYLAIRSSARAAFRDRLRREPVMFNSVVKDCHRREVFPLRNTIIRL
jgi:SAM-dependent methyltransferase